MFDRDAEVKAFFRLVAKGPVEEIRSRLAAEPGLVHAVGPHPFWGGRPQALHVAIENGRADVVALLLGAGADVNGSNQGYDRWSPLMAAAHRGHARLRDALLANGAEVGVVEALLLGDDARLEELLAGGADALPSPPPNDGSLLIFARTPLAVDRLLALGVSPVVADRWGVRPMDAFLRLGERGRVLVDRLVARGVPKPSYDLVLLAMVEAREHGAVSRLLAQSLSPNARAAGPARQTALHTAAWNGDLRMVQLLVEAGADLDALDDEHNATPQLWAETAVDVTGNPECALVARYLAGLSKNPG